MAKVGSKFCQTKIKPSKVCQRVWKVSPSGEISPNLAHWSGMMEILHDGIFLLSLSLSNLFFSNDGKLSLTKKPN